MPGISKGLPKYVDLGHVTNPNGRSGLVSSIHPGEIVFELDTKVEPANLGHILAPNTTYRISLTVGMANSDPMPPIRFMIKLGPAWSSDPEKMRKSVEVRAEGPSKRRKL